MAEASLATEPPTPVGVRSLPAEALAGLLEGGRRVTGQAGGVLLVDSRPFADFNARRIAHAINVNASKLLKRRLQRDKVHVKDVLRQAAGREVALEAGLQLVVYDEDSWDACALRSDAFAAVLLLKLQPHFPSVRLLAGGFSQFSHQFACLCEGKQTTAVAARPSSPPAATPGPTRILPHLYLGCQGDVLNKVAAPADDVASGVTSACLPFCVCVCVRLTGSDAARRHRLRAERQQHVPQTRLHRRLALPEGSRGRRLLRQDPPLVGRLAGLHREGRGVGRPRAGPLLGGDLALGHHRYRLHHEADGHVAGRGVQVAAAAARIAAALPTPRAPDWRCRPSTRRFVKEKRPSISPNFNFLGQLLDFEKKISQEAQRQVPAGGQQVPAGRRHSARPDELARAPGGLRPEDAAQLHGAPESARHFSPVEEVSEQSWDESAVPRRWAPGAWPGGTLRGWHSDILPAPGVRRCLSPTDTAPFYSAAFARGPEAPPRQPRASDRGVSRRSWHEESHFEKTRSYPDRTENQLAAPDSFSASLELIGVS
ncbi:dual specificity protein phosphatase 16 isoform X1 [Syngnathus typhle]|uniref:dual specificity protein phosphatase 16 isoform X1 n=1 Tax=Syngnathus typhle TaxID=161592 RepID=UPI002A69EC48|nr:dual specificity protein phosphatase 16 isoform X1 [Syngnathus typhle]